jgi:hypothetical protein
VCEIRLVMATALAADGKTVNRFPGGHVLPDGAPVGVGRPGLRLLS